MAGYYDNVQLDSCYELYYDKVNDKTYGYTMDRNYVMRPNLVQAPLLRRGALPDFYGPKVGNRVTQESFLQGRGHCTNKCPDCEVIYLPGSVFPHRRPVQSSCERVDLDPFYTRVPKSCNGLVETDLSVYRFMPENYKRGYQGYSALNDTHIQTRVPPSDERRPLSACASSYGSYGPQWDMSRYH